jgi:hypothetical protein
MRLRKFEGHIKSYYLCSLPSFTGLKKEIQVKCKPTPAAQRPGFRPEGTRREKSSLVMVGNALGANPPGL